MDRGVRRARPAGRRTPPSASPSTSRRRSRIRPRSQRRVEVNAGGRSRAATRTDGAPAPTRRAVGPDRRGRAPRASRAVVAAGRPDPAERRAEVHQGVGPAAGLDPPGRSRRPRPGGARRRCREGRPAADDAPEHPPDVHVDRTDALPERERGDGPRRVRPEARQPLERGDVRRQPAAVLAPRPSRRSAGGSAPAGRSRGPARSGARRPARRRRAPRRSGSGPSRPASSVPARAIWVCWAMTSLTRIGYGSRVPRNGSSPAGGAVPAEDRRLEAPRAPCSSAPRPAPTPRWPLSDLDHDVLDDRVVLDRVHATGPCRSPTP